MKKTASRNKKKTHCSSVPNPEVDTQAVQVLRTVRDDEAFYFYEAIGKPTGQTARNLQEFLDEIKSAKPQSLMFHHARRDFQNWTEKVLGDTKLARKLEKIASSNGDQVKTEIRKAVETRLKQLRESSRPILVDEDLPVLPVPL